MPTVMSHAVVGLAFGIRFHSMWGHRGLSHSLLGAVVLGAAAAALAHRSLGLRFIPLALYGAALTASHGVLDAFTNGGPGIAFFAPFDSTRYFVPWRPIPVSPLATNFFSEWGWHVFKAELYLLGLPSAIVLTARLMRTRGPGT